ncbi:hypothetical protein Taro_017878, partial [Colocasia esculenta]|nr:hypothetical protein [Colocasia esculenta]
YGGTSCGLATDLCQLSFDLGQTAELSVIDRLFCNYPGGLHQQQY